MGNLPCEKCGAACCKTNPSHDGARLGEGITPFTHGACALLVDGRCSIWGEARQATCRLWRCDKDARFRRENPAVDALLKAEGL